MPRNEQAVKVKAMEIQLVVGLFGFCSPVQSTTGSTVSSGTLLPLGVESGPLVSSWPSEGLQGVMKSLPQVFQALASTIF